MSPEALLIIRLLLHVATIVLLARYFNPDAKFKGSASVASGLVMASSGALVVQIVTDWPELVQSTPQPALLLFVFAVFLPVALARGNMATILHWLSEASHRHWRFWQ